MLTSLYRFARPTLFALAPEAAHEMTLRALEAGMYPKPRMLDAPCLRQRVMGLDFPNPIGIAAGYDKDARVPDAMLALGCGFSEVGTITPRPQSGNPKPRVFRLVEDDGLINRLGFNNGGHAAARPRLEARRMKPGIVGVNIGANKDSEDRTADYVAGLAAFYHVAGYFTVNISSPNTPGLRDLQAPAALDALLKRIMSMRDHLAANSKVRRPIVVKLAPDIANADIAPIVAVLIANNVDAIAVSNTTLDRPGLTSALASESGGLSGRPLFTRSTVMLARVYLETRGKIPLIGIGGIDSGDTALRKIEAGASLLQLYTGLIYQGPGLIGTIKQRLVAAAKAQGAKSISELVGRTAESWAARDLR